LCDCIPLCRWHHKLNAQSYHALGRRRFEQVHEISIREILERLHRRPQIRIQAGEFVATFDREDYRRLSRRSVRSGWRWSHENHQSF
jgi:hypothetical protein